MKPNIEKTLFFCLYLRLCSERQIFTILMRILVIKTQYVNKRPLDFIYTKKDLFEISFPQSDEKI